MRDLVKATLAIVEPIALNKNGCMSGDDLRATYAAYAPRGVGFEEAIAALEYGRLVQLAGMKEHGQSMMGYQLTVAGEAMADMLMGRNPDLVIQAAAKAILQTAHSEGLVAAGFGACHVGPARAAAIFDNLLAHEYLAPPSLQFGHVTRATVAVITPRGLSVLDYAAIQL